MSNKVLVVEDDPDIQELLERGLTNEGLRVTAKSSGEDALMAAKEDDYDIVLLDIMLPGIDGIEVCRKLKADPATERVPIIFLSARSEEADIVSGLEMGAMNYVVKPFSLKAVVALIRATLRSIGQSTIGQDGVVRVSDCVLHPGKHELRVNGKVVDLTLTEFRILKLLMKKPGWVFSRFQIVDAVHGADHSVTDRAVDIQIVGLRRKMGEAGANIQTVRGIGYRFREPASQWAGARSS